tara:strand:- start:507 stop:905 length:399 start_codon:yes stop_codon:yes gene_type:complete
MKYHVHTTDDRLFDAAELAGWENWHDGDSMVGHTVFGERRQQALDVARVDARQFLEAHGTRVLTMEVAVLFLRDMTYTDTPIDDEGALSTERPASTPLWWREHCRRLEHAIQDAAPGYLLDKLSSLIEGGAA